MQQLQTIDADTLMSTPLPVTQFIVEGLLPEGLHILAGSPKIGKSWLALWICLRVSTVFPSLPTLRCSPPSSGSGRWMAVSSTTSSSPSRRTILSRQRRPTPSGWN